MMKEKKLDRLELKFNEKLASAFKLFKEPKVSFNKDIPAAIFLL